MKKLLCSAAVAALVAVAAAPAMAQGDQSALKLDLGGYFRGYVVYHDQDSHRFAEERNVDIIRDTEVHFTGETTLDNGLTVGVHVEATADREDVSMDESYLYTSGSWGRINFGSEDGSAYLLQVAAPSADSNIDGIRQYVNPANYIAGSRTAWVAGTTSTPFNFTNLSSGRYTASTTTNLPAYYGAAGVPNGIGTGVVTDAFTNGTTASFTATPGAATVSTNVWGRNNGAFLSDDYAQDATRYADKLTYLSPVFNGFQAGVSYTPDVASNGFAGAAGLVGSRGLNGVGEDDVVNAFGSAWELAARYEGQFDRFGLTLGAGYTHIDLEETKGADTGAPGVNVYTGLVRNAFTDDRDLWNVGGTVSFGGFTFGGLYSEDDRGEIAQDLNTARADYTTDSDSETWVLGLDYTTGPWKVGASYLNREVENMGVVYNGAGTAIGYSDLETDRYSAGVTYTYGPGMTFRGSVHHIEHEVGSSDMDATSFLLGTQVNF